jgi:hypothetical protein
MASLTQKHDPQGVVQLRIRDDDPLNGDMTDARWNRTGKAIQLLMNIRRGVQKKPPLSVHTNSRGRLAASNCFMGCLPAGSADRTPAVPLGETTSCRGAE